MKINFAVVFIIADLLMTPLSQAQCPDNSLQTLVGTWTFSTWGTVASSPVMQGVASVGRLAASISPTGVGLVTITQTTNYNGQITRSGFPTGVFGPDTANQITWTEAYRGTYQIFPDCTGGTLTVNVSSLPSPSLGDSTLTGTLGPLTVPRPPIQLDFVFTTVVGAGRGIRLMGIAPPSVSVSGTGELVALTCSTAKTTISSASPCFRPAFGKNPPKETCGQHVDEKGRVTPLFCCDGIPGSFEGDTGNSCN